MPIRSGGRYTRSGGKTTLVERTGYHPEEEVTRPTTETQSTPKTKGDRKKETSDA